ncbi:BrnA antitoxin family protein [Desulfococcus sp.]|uniref:BrnA antitoxin family protein n=1 Tax=Desulfococcus sp. TaxID=2025834 RepID=UPI0035936F40
MKKEYNFEKAKRGQIVAQKGKSRITIYIDTDVLDQFRERADKAGYGYQTMINEALRQYLEKNGKPLDETLIRQVIREELDRVPHHES